MFICGGIKSDSLPVSILHILWGKKMLVLHSQGGEYIPDQLCVRAPSTPECDREDEHARQHAAALQMTSPTHCQERAATATASRSCNQPPPPPQPFPHPPL